MKKTKSKDKKNRYGKYGTKCPYCGKPASFISAAGILPNGSGVTQIYACSDYPDCDSYVCVHPGTNYPMGNLASRELRTLRQQTHYYFDKLYIYGLMTRSEAYAWLADKVWLPRREAHIGFLDEEACQLVIDESKEMLSSWKENSNYQHSIKNNRYDGRLHA